MDNSGRIVHFDEKPPADRLPGLLSELPGGGSGYLASMGIYLFKREVLEEAVANPQAGRLRPPRHPRRGAPPARAGATSIAATGRTSGPSSRTSRPTWRCATRSRLLISTTRSARSTPTRASCRRRSWRAATSAARSSPRAASCTAPRSIARHRHPQPHRRRARIRNSLLIGADHYETLDEMRADGGARHARRSASARTRSSRTRSSTRTRASGAVSASSTRRGSNTPTATATSSARAS